jgi:hypothetical protein
MTVRLAILALLSAPLLSTAAYADDWTAIQLRGSVQELVSGAWKPLHRGDVVPDSRTIRTSANGRVTFTRGKETLELSPNTQIEIYDRGGVLPFTTVKEAFGSVSVEAEVRNVQHFSVETPYLAAVVKGTRFTVSAGKNTGSVTVSRGQVAVENKINDSHVTILVGQSAKVDLKKTGDSLVVAGPGKLPDVIGANGKPLPKPKPVTPDPKDKGPAGPQKPDGPADQPKGPKGDKGPAGGNGPGKPADTPKAPGAGGPGAGGAGGGPGAGGAGGPGGSAPTPPSPPSGGPGKP